MGLAVLKFTFLIFLLVEVTTAQPSRSCTAAEFRCNSGDCVGLDVMCDGRSDCLDGSDERNCRICDAATEFDCGGGFCVNSQYRCDGRQDCPSNRDEENCDAQCGLGTLSCNDRRSCYTPQQRCDGRATCLDQSDEWDCASLIQVTVSPKTSAVEVGESATFTCSATCPRAIQSCDVQWGFNSVNGRLPAGVDTTGTFLRVGYADLSHTGVYYCSVIGYSQISDYAELTVRRRASCSANEFTCNNQRCVSRSLLCNNVDDCGDRTDEANCIESNQCEPPEMRCANGKCVQKFWRCDGDDDCKDGTDEQNQYCPIVPPNSFCAANQFQCASGNQCTRKSYVCDKQFDCLDRSDEIGCSAPVCTQAPRRTITVNVGETITISCTCIGKPVPYISWRLNWGHIPSGSRVTETSVNGVGTLIIRDARPSDAGAYTCEAVNNQNSVFANPDAIVTVNEIINSCPAGQFNPGNCLPCYCSDLSSTCRSSNMVMREIYIRSQVTLVDERGLEVSTSLYSDDRNGKYTVPVYSWLPSGNHYWKLPSSLTGNQLNMYGGILKYRISYEDLRRSSLSDVYDVIIKGAFSTTYCRAAATYVPGRDVRISLQMIEDFCYQASTGSSADIRIPSPTSREEYMNILMNVEHILIRATYSSTQTSTSISDISVEQAAPSGSTKPATMVEVCDSCPAGYVGNSCEDCDKGYRRLPPSQYYPRGECVRDVAPCLCNGHSQTCDELDGTCLFCQHNTEGSRCQYCKAGYIGDATVGRPDDCQPIPTPCNRDGTDYEDRGRCVCKAFATGQYCDQCKATSFYLNDHSAGGCTQCFCMGITSNCDSSSDRRDDITVSYNTADDWSLAESNSQPVLGNVLSANGREIIASLRLLGAGSYYWSLPSQFTGNKLAAYGGKLRFTSKFVAPSVDQPNRDADVILFGAEGIQLTATFEGIILDNRQHNAEIVMLENYWRRADSSPSTREHFLMALSDIQYILVKASFTRNTEESRIEDVRLDIASTTGLGARAYDVEQCACPAGYVGSSCETCAPGYMRAPGLYLGVCNRCSCNGHSDDCTSDQCLNCNHGTTGRFCERCAPGYVRNARDQSPHECINPTSAAVIESPTIRVTIGGRAEFVCRPYSADLPYSSIIWRRSDGQPLPRTASQSQPGRLIIDNVQLTYSGDYVCVITTAGGVDASSIASLVVVTSTCPTGYENLPDCNICSVGYTKDAYGRCVPSSTQIVVTVSPSNSVRVSEGQSIRLLCSARSQVDNSVYVVSWSREGARLPGTAVEANGQLYIAQSAVADSGIYVCTGSNQFGRQTAQVSVRVDPILPPTTVLTVEVDPDKLYITEGLSGVLRCKITGDARSVTWRRSSNTPITSKNRVSTSVVSGDTLTIIGMDVNDRGYYYCTAVGADATTRVTSDRPALVDFKRTGSDDDSKEAGHSFVTILNIDVRVTEGDPARLECRADSSVRASSISWSKNGQQLYSDKGVLVIQATSVSDSGTYTCTIYTVTGDYQSKEARITVTQRPVTLPAPEVRIRDSGTGTLKYAVGANVQLFCDQVAGPQGLNVYWESGEVGRPLASNVIANGGLLSIQSITLANRGLYVCIGTDGRRLDRKEVYIQVEELKISLPEVIDAPMGEGVEITCSVSRRTLTDTIPTVYWRNSRGQRLTDITSLESTLQFNPVRMSHAGNYTCVAEIPGASSSATLVLRVIPSPTGPIRFAQNPLDLRVQIGESASVDCQPTTSLITSTTWSRDNANSLPSTAVQRGSQLDFRSIRLADAGTYICTAISSLGSGSLYVNLIVEGPPGLPVVTANGDQLAPNGVKVYNVGDSVTLNCIAEGSPAPQYSWSRMLVQGSFQPLYTGGNVQISYGTLSGLGSQLVLSNVQTSDAGYYNCSASNIYASRDTYARLVINPANNGGNFAPTDAKVRGSGSGILRNMYNIGDTAILRCQASSATPVSYRWTFSNGALPTNAYSKSAVLEIVNMGKSNEGIYYCTVQNAAGSSRPAAAQVFVSSGTNSGPGSVPAMPTTAPGAPVVHKIKEGDSVSMSCLSDVNTSWKRDNGQRLSANSYSSTASLRILDVKPGDQGRYLCVATNQYGDSAPLVHTLYVETPATVRPETPSVSITADSSVNIGDTVDLRCTSDIQTASITWSRAEVGVQLPENSAVSGQYLRIYNFKAEDAGYYVCTATTPQGSGIATHQLYALSSVLSAQIRAVGSLARPSTPNEYAEGSELRLYCEASDSSASVTWERLGDSLPAHAYISSTALIFRSLEEIDRGTYRCTASTSSSSVIADFRFDVIDTRSLGGAAVSSVEIYSGIIDYIDIGSRIELNCSAVGDDVYYEWKLQDGSALPSDAIVVDNVLIIPSFMSADQGTYVCTASNLYGQPMSHSLTLEIKAPISSVKIITNIVDYISEGDRIDFSCVAVGDDPVYQWERTDGSLALPSSAIFIGSQLTIPRVTAADQGTYKCTASSAYGAPMSDEVVLKLG